jgi:thiol:disulfide interchange protein
MSLAILVIGTMISYNTKMQMDDLKNNLPIQEPPIHQEQESQPPKETDPIKPEESEEWREYSGEEYLQVLEKAKKDQKEIILFFTAEWCSSCKQMKSNTLSKENVKKELKNYHYVVINTDNNRELTTQFKIQAIPTFIHLKSDGTQIGKTIVGNRSESEFLKWISAK